MGHYINGLIPLMDKGPTLLVWLTEELVVPISITRESLQGLLNTYPGFDLLLNLAIANKQKEFILLFINNIHNIFYVVGTYVLLN